MPSIADDTPPDEPLYHYTSLRGLQGIVKDGAVFATHISYLNDSGELKWAVQLFRSRVLDYTQSGNYEGKQKECLEQFRQWLPGVAEIRSSRYDRRMVFVAAFTTEGNLLSQWRGYCPPGSGVSIGFRPEAIAKQAALQGFQFRRYLYDEVGEHIPRLDLFRARLLEELQVTELPTHYPPERTYLAMFERQRDSLLDLLSVIKHPAYKEEKEWRVILHVLPDQFADTGIMFRDGVSCLLPYVLFKLPTEETSGKLAIAELRVAPGPSTEPSLGSVELYLAKEGLGFGLLGPSDIPFRPPL